MISYKIVLVQENFSYKNIYLASRQNLLFMFCLRLSLFPFHAHIAQ